MMLSGEMAIIVVVALIASTIAAITETGGGLLRSSMKPSLLSIPEQPQERLNEELPAFTRERLTSKT